MKRKKMKKIPTKNHMVIGGAVLIITMFFAWAILSPSTGADLSTISTDTLTVYKSQGCGCCGGYISYLDSKAGIDINVVDVDDVTPKKDEFGVPAGLRSCHTSTIAGYFLEGHVPLEAVQKLLTEKPDIKGLAMSGMPSGSPGMPGSKSGAWTIYAVNNDGSQNIFMTI